MNNKFKNIILKGVFVAFLVFSFSACETTELEILDNPNGLTPNTADAELFINNIQVETAYFFEGPAGFNGMSEWGMEVTRMLHMFGPTYDNAYTPNLLDGPWSRAYAVILADIRALQPLAEEAGLYTHNAIAMVLEAYVMATLVDYLGDVPYTQAIQGTDFPNPAVDDGASIYAALITLIDNAIIEFNRDEISKPANDLYYDGSESKWIQFANSLKLKLYLQTRLVDSSVGPKIDALIADDNLMEDSADDFEFQYSAVDASPDSRHGVFAENFNVAADVNDYMSNSYIVAMKDEKSVPDPRLRYYFYRQSLNFTTDVNENDCITLDAPDHYADGEVFCNPGDGYWGRDHADNDGIPPDGGLRTAWGLYPVGGLFDNDAGEAVPGRDIGVKGAGISPILLSSYVDFMLAESALTLGTTGDAKTYLESAVRGSIDKVMNFAPAVVDDAFAPSTADVDEYVADVLALYDAAGSDDAKLEVIVKEYWIALFGNGVEAYNTYRRTGKPANLQPGLLAAQGEFINSFLYPSELVDQNSSVSQKANQGVRVFWAVGGPTVD